MSHFLSTHFIFFISFIGICNAQTAAPPQKSLPTPAPVFTPQLMFAAPTSPPKVAPVNSPTTAPTIAPVGSPVAPATPVTAAAGPPATIPVATPVNSVTNEEAVDLGETKPLSTPAPTPAASPKPVSAAKPMVRPPATRPASSGATMGGSLKLPSAINFKVYFDLNLVHRPGINELTFDNYHAFLFLEGMPMPGIQFNFDVGSTPRFYELDWQLTPTLQLRAGKIWIPFDDTHPHNIYGGRVSVSRIAVGAAFLPDLWTDLGVGLKWTTVDVKNMNIIGDIYVVNGFRSGGTDPVTAGNKYPIFSDLPSTADNNTDKAIGGRVHGLFWNRHGLGGSFYTARWTDQADTSRRVYIFGVDYQFKVDSLMDFRAGLASMRVNLPTSQMNRAGTYAELGRYIDSSRAWKATIRGGTLQMDDRVIDVNDQRIVGAMITWRPNVIMFSLEHSRDIQRFSGKRNYTFTNLRMVIMF